MWRGLISISAWVVPAIHHPDGLLIGFCAANLTFRNKHKMLSRAKRSPTPMVRRARLSESCVCLSISTDGRESRRVSDYQRTIRTAQAISGRLGLHIPGSYHWSEIPVRLGAVTNWWLKTYAVEKRRSDESRQESQQQSTTSKPGFAGPVAHKRYPTFRKTA
jgi:hypothetical protein